MDQTALHERPGSAGQARWFEKRADVDAVDLPRLADAMGAVARSLGEALGNLSASPGEVRLKGIRTGRVETLPGRRGPAAVLAIAQVPDWKTPIGLLFDQTLVSMVVEAFFGGGSEDTHIPEREFLSPVETRIADVIAEQAAEAIETGFGSILPTRVLLEAIRPKPDPALLGKPATAVLIATLVLRAAGRTSELDIVLPRAPLEAFRDILAVHPDRPGPAPDPDWSGRLEAEVSRATMRLRAAIELSPMSLRSVAELHPGQVLALPAGAGTSVSLSCGPDRLFRCELGQSAGFYTVRIDEPVAPSASPSRKADR